MRTTTSRGWLAAALSLTIAGTVTAPFALAQGRGSSPAPLWQERLDPAGGFDSAFHVTARGPRAYAAGGVTLGARQAAFMVRGYDLRTGALLWEHHDDRGEANDLAYGVAATEDAVFAVGAVRDPDDADWLVRSFDQATGSLLWEDQFDHANRNDFASDLAIAGGALYVSGIVLAPSVDPRFPINFDWGLRAYDPDTGQVLWEAETDLAGANDQALDLAAGGGVVAQAGFVETASEDRDHLVRAWDAASGALLWEHRVDAPGSDDSAIAVALDGGRVIAAGVIGGRFSVRAYDASSGVLAWEDRVDLGGGIARARSVAIAGMRAFVTGSGMNEDGNEDLLVRAYDVRTGALLWSDRVDHAGGDDLGMALAVGAGQVFAAGATGLDSSCVFFLSGNCAMSVRAYRMSTGQLVWAAHDEAAGGNDLAFTIATQGGRVVVGGRISDPPGDIDWELRVYPAQGGKSSP